MQQKRIILALVISTVILFGWNYFFPPPTAKQNNSNTATEQQQPSASPSSSAQAAPAAPSATPQTQTSSTASDAASPRTLVIKTPLYEATLDNHGAVVTSWIVKAAKDGDSYRPLYSVAGTREQREPLQLISQEGLKHEPREAPLRLVTGDKTVDDLLALEA